VQGGSGICFPKLPAATTRRQGAPFDATAGPHWIISTPLSYPRAAD